MKRLSVIFMLFLLLTTRCFAGETATPQEIFDMVIKGVSVLESLGDEGLQAFNDPKGEFVWKDTYVQVYNCDASKIVGHINPKLLEWSTDTFQTLKDVKGNSITKLICEAAKNPQGGWVEYWWPKPGEKEPSRKITFVIQVPGKPYQVSAGIYDDKITIAELDKINN